MPFDVDGAAVRSIEAVPPCWDCESAVEISSRRLFGEENGNLELNCDLHNKKTFFSQNSLSNVLLDGLYGVHHGVKCGVCNVKHFASNCGK